MPYVQSSMISRTGYGDAGDGMGAAGDHFDADVRAAFAAHQGVSGALGDLSSAISSNLGMIAAGAAVYVLFFRKKKR